MALTIENGTGVAGATSYISVADARAYAAARGLTLPAADAAVEVLLTDALDYIEALRMEFQGVKTAKANALQWPRTGVMLDGYALDVDEIPDVIPNAQAQLACDAYGGGTALDLMPVGAGREVIRESVEGAVEVEYAPSGTTNPQPQLTRARALLEPLLKGRGGGIRWESVRV